MYVLSHVPLLKFLPFFILGILAGNAVSCLWLFLIVLLIGVGVLVISDYYLRSNLSRKGLVASTVLVQFILIVAGALLVNLHNQINSPYHFSKYQNPQAYVGVVSSAAKYGKTVSFEFQVDYVVLGNNLQKSIGKVNVNLNMDSNSELVIYGDELVLNKQVQEIARPKNPGSFNFKAFYQIKNVNHSVWLKSSEWRKTGRQKRNKVKAWSYCTRNKLIAHFDKHLDEDVVEFAKALVLGYKQHLPTEVKQDFSRTGTIHVLAVSGLHVGLIYGLLSIILAMKKGKLWVRVIKALILVGGLFAYELITGLSISVLRSVIMFSLFVMAELSGRKSSSPNTVLLAGFVLLCLDPLALYNLGFQFSFLAVLGIVLFAKTLSKKWKHQWWITGKLKELIAVSLCAQIFVLPLSLYYFHAFPVYFLVANLLVVPLVTVGLYLGVGFATLGLLSSAVSKILADLMEAYLRFSIGLNHMIGSWPNAIVSTPEISVLCTWMVLGFIASLSFGLFYRQKLSLNLSVWCFAAILFVYELDRKTIPDSEVIVFHHNRSSLIGFRSNQKLVVLASKEAYTDDKVFEYLVEPYSEMHNVKSIVYHPISRVDATGRIGDLVFLGNGCLGFKNELFFVDQLGLNLDLKNTKFRGVFVDGKWSSNRAKLIDEKLHFDTGILMGRNVDFEGRKWKANKQSYVIIR